MLIPQPGPRDTALAAFTEAKADIDAMLTRLAEHSANHFGFSPDQVNWGGVAGVERARFMLREVCNFAFGEGETL